MNSKPQGSSQDVVLRGKDPRPAKENTCYHIIKKTRDFQLQRRCDLLCLLCYLIAQHLAVADDIRPYEFSFNIVDFQHRFEKKGIPIKKSVRRDSYDCK